MSTGVYRTTTWAMLDQAVVSGGNFLTNLVLIRTLAPPSYGAYALILNAILFLNNLHNSMVAYPVTMRGAKCEEDALGGVATGGLLATSAGLVVNALLITGACLSIHHGALIPVVIATALFWQLQETLRTVFVSRLSYHRALPGDALSYLGQAGLLAFLCWHHVPSLAVVFLVVIGTSVVAGGIQAAQIRPHAPHQSDLRSFFGELWELGRWSTLAKFVAFFTFQALPWLLAYTSGLTTVASFQSLSQLGALANPLLIGFNNLIIASIASRHRVAGSSSWRAASKQIRLASILLGSYFVVLALFGHFVMRLVYGSHSPYLVFASFLPAVALAQALESVAMFAGAILGGIGQMRLSFWAQLCTMGTSVLLVFPWIFHSGLKGAVYGLVAIGVTRAGAACYLAWRGLRAEALISRKDEGLILS